MTTKECEHCNELIRGEAEEVTCDVCELTFHNYCFEDQGGIIDCACCASMICGECDKAREEMEAESEGVRSR